MFIQLSVGDVTRMLRNILIKVDKIIVFIIVIIG